MLPFPLKRISEIDVAFPVHDSIWSAEGQGIVQTSDLIETGIRLVYRGEYQEGVYTGKIALSQRSPFLSNFVASNYPDSEIYVADTLEDCLDAVKKGNAT